jgi:ABC-type Mn2+/Zn2+ transport system ATPase subunit
VSGARTVLQVSGLLLRGAFEPIDLHFRAGEIVGVDGLLDSGKSRLGKSRLGKVIAGVLPPSAGAVALLGRSASSPEIGASVAAGLGYVPAERLAEGMIAPFSVAWNISLGSGGDRATTPLGFWRTRREIRVAKDYIERLRIRSAQPDTACARLSDGNQQKVVLSRWLSGDLGVLVLDNPTRGVDAGAKKEIYRVIRDLNRQGRRRRADHRRAPGTDRAVEPDPDLFVADILGVDAAYKESWDTYLKEAVQVPINDSDVLAATLVAATEHLGLTFTTSILQEHPFNFARKLSTLDHLSKGRVGWNIVTSVSNNAAQLGWSRIDRRARLFAGSGDAVRLTVFNPSVAKPSSLCRNNLKWRP